MSKLSWEEKQQLKSDLKRINVTNLVEQVRALETLVRATAGLIEAQNQKIAVMDQEIQALKQTINMDRIDRMGGGPTVK